MRRNALFRCSLVAALLAVMPFATLRAHPIHMSFTELLFTDGGKAIELSVRVFTDDFSMAAARYSQSSRGAHGIIDSSSGFSYLMAKIRLSGENEAPVTLVPCGVRRLSDMLRFCFRARLISPGKPIRIANTVMTEVFPDQVNVVQSVRGRDRASRMFVRGDGWKVIP